MVLDDASPQFNSSVNEGSSSFENDSYPSTIVYAPNDPVSFLKTYPVNIQLPPYTFGRRLLMLKSQSGYETSLSRLIAYRVCFGTVVANRLLDQDEIDFFVWQASASQLLRNAGGWGGLIGGIGFATQPYGGLRHFAGILEGRFTKAHLEPFMTRRSLFALPVAIIFGIITGSSFGALYGNLKTATDPRLARFRQDLQSQGHEAISKRVQQFANGKLLAGELPSVPLPQQSSQRQFPSSQGVANTTNELASDSEYSSARYDSPSSYNDDPQAGILNQVRTQQRQKYQQEQQPWSQTSNTSAGSDASDFFGDSEASSSSSQSVVGTQSGSAWDRLRRNASSSTPYSRASGTNSNNNNNYSQQSHNGEFFASEGDRGSSFPTRETSLNGKESREQAQREFDRLLEKERQAGDGERDAFSRDTWSKRW